MWITYIQFAAILQINVMKIVNFCIEKYVMIVL